jgi:hypothetical protein
MNKIGYVFLLVTSVLPMASCSDNENVQIDQNFAKNLPGVYKYTLYNSYYKVDYIWRIARMDNKLVNLVSEISYTIYSGNPETHRDTIENIVLGEADQLKFTYENTGFPKYKLDANGKVNGNILDIKLLTTWSASPQESYDLKLEKQ